MLNFLNIKKIMEKDKSYRDGYTNTNFIEEMTTKQVTLKDNLKDWCVYFIFCVIFLTPFFGGEWAKHACASLMVSFLFGMLNRIIREVSILNNK